MNETHIARISEQLDIGAGKVLATVSLLADGATVPFISRYRKEATGSLDEVAITAVRDRMEQLQELDKRRDAILKSLDERELLTDELRDEVVCAATMTDLEDVYLPYRPKRRTRAMIAREKGLEPLALILLAQTETRLMEEIALEYVDEEKEVKSAEEALQGARDIVAETVSDDADVRQIVRELTRTHGVFNSSAKILPFPNLVSVIICIFMI